MATKRVLLTVRTRAGDAVLCKAREVRPGTLMLSAGQVRRLRKLGNLTAAGVDDCAWLAVLGGKQWVIQDALGSGALVLMPKEGP